MSFDLGDDEEALRDGLRSFCAGRFTMERVRGGFDRSAFDELAETGVLSLRTDGFTWVDAALAFGELGRALVPGPLVWSHLAHGLVDGVVTGVDARVSGDGVVIEHLGASDAVVVLGDDGIRRIDASALSDAVEIEWPLDPLTPVHRLASLPAGEVIADAGVAREWRQGGALLTSAFQSGMALACVEAADAFALERQQFNRPIGSFQAVKHILADMAVRAEVAKVAVDAAACALDDPEGATNERALSGARLLAGEAALDNAKSSLQVHGGMGFTWEVDVHLYLKRAWVLNTAFGTPTEHADTLAATLR